MFHLLVLAGVLSASVADEVAHATASPQLQKAYWDSQRLHQDMNRLRHDFNLGPHQHLDDPYRRNDARRDYDDRRDEKHDDVRHRDEWRHDEKRHKERDQGERSHEDKRNDERSHDEKRHEERGHEERRHEERRHDELRDHQPHWWTDKDNIKHVDDEHDIPGPVILRNIKSHDDHRHLNIARQNKIVADVYSPDYAQPTWIIDYRYLKSGGRDYTRGPGGQILILPKGIRTNEHKEFKDYDELIEHLRQQNLAERSKPSYFMPLGQEIDRDYKNKDLREHRDYKDDRKQLKDDRWYQ